MRWIFSALFFLALAAPVLASDGVLEINQTCAVHTGCFPGDTAGFPVTISASGSYRLTGNLEVPNTETTAISVDADDVSIELGGFSVLGSSGCTEGEFAPAVCPAVSTGYGVYSDSRNVSVEGGTIRGMGRDGIRVSGRGSGVARVRAFLNRGNGIFLDDKCLVSDSVASGNGSAGFRVGWWCVVETNSSTANGDQGISGQSETIIRTNSVSRNGNNGIDTNDAGLIASNIVADSGAIGILGDDKTRIVDNVVRNSSGAGIYAAETSHVVSGNSVSQSGQNGIVAGAGSSVSGNTVHAGAGYGLVLESDASYRENTIVTKAGADGPVQGGVDAGGNVCNGSLTCP